MVIMALAMVDMEGTVDGEDMVDTPDMVLAMVDMVDTGEERRGMPMPNQLLMLYPMLTLTLMPTIVTMVLAMVDMGVMVDTEDMVDMVLGMVDIEVMVDMVSGVEKRGTLMLSQLLMQMLMLMPMLTTDITDMAVDGEAMEDGEDMVAFTDLMAMDTGERNKRYSPQKW